jgi:multicomponent Na+:H+ antiporter subunit G
MARNIIAIVFSSIGAFWFLLGTTGLLRMPDVFSRLHPATKCDTLGACSVIVGVAVYSGAFWDIMKLVLVMCFLLLSSATCGHAIGRSAVRRSIEPWRKSEKGE